MFFSDNYGDSAHNVLPIIGCNHSRMVVRRSEWLNHDHYIMTIITITLSPKMVV